MLLLVAVVIVLLLFFMFASLHKILLTILAVLLYDPLVHFPELLRVALASRERDVSIAKPEWKRCLER